jgi:hypothetical protein
MADTDFAALGAASTIAPTDSIVIARGGVPYRTTAPLPSISAAGFVGLGTSAGFGRLTIEGSSGTLGAALQITGTATSSLFVGQDSLGGVVRAQGGANQFRVLLAGNYNDAPSASGIEAARFDTGFVSPGGDNGQTLGAASKRWSVVYAGTGSISTSDAREKQDVGVVPDAWLDAWGDVQWVRFRFTAAAEEKGGTARWHLGAIAQQVHQVFADHGLDAFEIGLCCRDAWEEETEPVLVPIASERVFTRQVLVPAGEIDGAPVYAVQTVETREAVEEMVDTGDRRVTLPAGDRWGLRYTECQVIEAAWQRRELARLRALLPVEG